MYKLKCWGEIYDDFEMEFEHWENLRQEILDQCQVLKEIIFNDNQLRMLATKEGNEFYKNLQSTIIPSESFESLLIEISPYYNFQVTKIEQ